MRLIEKVWFYQHKAKWLLVPLLLPLTVLFYLASTFRRFAFRVGLKQSIQVKAPVVVVGNIGVGGNGKTPVVLHLVELCKSQGLTPGVISRGYGGTLSSGQSYPLLLNQYTSATEAGDEPHLIYHRGQVPVAVGPDRVASATLLIEHGCNIIIADDGLQHYRLKRDCEIIVVDGKRWFGNGLLLPAGPLREGAWRLNTVDHVIINGESSVDLPNNALSMVLQPTHVKHMLTGKSISVSEFIEQHPEINAVAGIGDPQRFFDTLTLSGLKVIEQRGFVDHHAFELEDFAAFEPNYPLLMTEKDAVKCQSFAQGHWWYLAVSAQFNEQDNTALMASIKQVYP